MKDPDQLPSGRSIYEVSHSEIFWRNFLAGFARGLGNFIFTLLLFFIITAITARFLMPIVNPLFESMTSINGILGTINSTQPRATAQPRLVR